MATIKEKDKIPENVLDSALTLEEDHVPVSEGDFGPYPWEVQGTDHFNSLLPKQPGKIGRFCNPKLRDANGWDIWRPDDPSIQVRKNDVISSHTTPELAEKRNKYMSEISKDNKRKKEEKQAMYREEIRRLRESRAKRTKYFI